LDDSCDKFRQVLATERLSPLKGYIHYSAALQFLKELEPSFFREILTYITRTAEMAAVGAAKIAAIRYR
jgi:hypothetical protein